MSGYVLSIDCGTQSLRTIIFDKDGKLIVKNKQSFEQVYYSKFPGWAEQDPNMYWDNLCKALQTIKEIYYEVFDGIDTVVITTQRDTCVLVDKKGEPVRDAILWADERSIDTPRKMSLLNEFSVRAVGMANTAKLLNRKCPAHWIQDNEPEIWAMTYKYLQLSGYLNFKLTGVFKDGVANQVGHIPFNYKKRIWEKPSSLKGQIFQVGQDKMCELIETSKILGHVTAEASLMTGLKEGISVVAGGSDKGCETLGVGCIDNKTVAISLGSQASIQTTSKKYYETLSFIPPFPGVDPKTYNPEIQIYRGYWMISWFKKEFAQKELIEADRLGVKPEQILDEALEKVPPGAEGLVLQPYWGAGLKKPEAKGAIIGFSDYHTRVHIYRAIIEGIGFALLEGMKKIEKKSGQKIEKIMISGGGSGSNIICQITADIFGLPVYRVQSYETASLGAAIVGYVANGTYNSFKEAIDYMVHETEPFIPNEKNRKVYRELYEKVYTKIYSKLKPFYKTIRDIIK